MWKFDPMATMINININEIVEGLGFDFCSEDMWVFWQAEVKAINEHCKYIWNCGTYKFIVLAKFWWNVIFHISLKGSSYLLMEHVILLSQMPKFIYTYAYIVHPLLWLQLF